MANLTDTFSEGSSNNVLEMIESPADGRTIEGVSGSYTIEDVTSDQRLGYSYTNITGSKIAYTPPAGTNYIYYNFEFKFQAGERSGISHYRLYVGGTEVNEAYIQLSSNRSGSSEAATTVESISFVFDLTASSNNVALGQFSDWTGEKEIVVKGRSYSTSYIADIHKNRYFDGGSASGDRLFSAPRLTLIALS